MQDGGYHVPFAHKGLASGLQLDSYQSEIHERVSIQTCQPQQLSASSDKRLGQPCFALPCFVLPCSCLPCPWPGSSPALPCLARPGKCTALPCPALETLPLCRLAHPARHSVLLCLALICSAMAWPAWLAPSPHPVRPSLSCCSSVACCGSALSCPVLLFFSYLLGYALPCPALS